MKPDDVTLVWLDIVLWCERYAPQVTKRFNSSADTEPISAHLNYFGAAGLTDVAQWYSANDGMRASTEYFQGLLFGADFLPLAGAQSLASLLRASHPGERDEQPGAAGEPTSSFRKAFIPIGEGSGETLFVDSRPGNRHGCVSRFSREDGCDGYRWVSIAEMLTALLGCVTTGEPIDGFSPDLKAGDLEWIPS